jgi:AhpD family alkylhydroperoxidase
MERTLGSIPGFFSAVPPDMLVQMWPAIKTYFLGQTRIPAKYREMISLAVAKALKCSSCETFHHTAAKMNGASDDELAEVGAILAQVTFWSTIMGSMNYDMSAFMREFQAMAERFAKQRDSGFTGQSV